MVWFHMKFCDLKSYIATETGTIYCDLDKVVYDPSKEWRNSRRRIVV